MKRIGLLSDTHGFLEDAIFEHFDACDEIWHAGDIGSLEVTDTLEGFRPLRAVYGNIDDGILRAQFPEDEIFTLEGVKVWMTHIAGYPGRYNQRIRTGLPIHQPKLMICGHSHILKVMPDRRFNHLHVNPGACGHHGFHHIRTIVRFTLDAGQIRDMEVVELGKRGAL